MLTTNATVKVTLVESALTDTLPLLVVNGHASLDGILEIVPAGLMVPPDTRINLLSADSLSGGFATLIDQTGSNFRVEQDGNTLYLTNAIVPSPTTVGLMVCLAVGLAMRRRRLLA